MNYIVTMKGEDDLQYVVMIAPMATLARVFGFRKEALARIQAHCENAPLSASMNGSKIEPCEMVSNRGLYCDTWKRVYVTDAKMVDGIYMRHARWYTGEKEG